MRPGFVKALSDTRILSRIVRGKKRVGTFHNTLKKLPVSVIPNVHGKMETLKEKAASASTNRFAGAKAHARLISDFRSIGLRPCFA